MRATRVTVLAIATLVGACGPGGADAPGELDSADASEVPVLDLTTATFPDTPVGTTSTTTVTVTNTHRRKALTITALVTSPPFYVEPLAAPLRLAPRQTTTIVVTFEPASVGTFTGQLVCSIANQTPQVFALAATAVASGTDTPPPPAPTPDPALTPGCSGPANHVAGGADGTGTCWPGPTNTGVPLGTALTLYTGPCNITTDGTVIDAKTFNCDVSIHAANVLIKNSKVNGSVILDVDAAGSSAWSFTLQDSEVDAGAQQISAVGWGNLTVIRSNIHGGETAVQCEEKSASCVIVDSYLHGQYLPNNEPWHLGGFLSDGGQNMTLRHNFVVCDHAVNSLGEGCTGDINFIPNFAAINGALVEHNLLGANVDAAYCTYGGEKSTSLFPHSYNVVYRDNVFQRGTNNRCADYGPVTDFGNNAGNQWLNNTWSDGTVIPDPR